jgi:hypothetical protein
VNWKAAYRLLVQGTRAEALNEQVRLALSEDGELDIERFQAMSGKNPR